MSRQETAATRYQNLRLTEPWPWMALGLVLTGLTAIVQLKVESSSVPLRAATVVVGIIAAGGAINLHLRKGMGDFGQRLRSAGLLALGGVAAWLGCWGIGPSWDTAVLALGVLSTIAFVAALVVLLPRTARRIVASLLIVFHFGGILMAVTSVHPPWLVQQTWTRVYRPYLQFAYLNNAYHFYSPEPGPPTLLWFYLRYDDGSSRWVKIPNREDFHTRLEFQRRLALTESTNQIAPLPADFEMRWQRRIIGDDMANVRPEFRFRAHEIQFLLATGQPDVLVIPPAPLFRLPRHEQFKPSRPSSKLMTTSYARYVAQNYPSETNPNAKIVGVKVYRVIHRILLPPDIVDGRRPLDEDTYEAFYLGEFDDKGELLDPNDPFLYWAIPNIKMAAGTGNLTEKKEPTYLEYHAKRIKTNRQ